MAKTVMIGSARFDENGKPTKWEAVDAGDEGVRTINGIAPDDNGNIDTTAVTLGLYELKIDEPRYTGYGFAIKEPSSGDVFSQLSQDGLIINASAGDGYYYCHRSNLITRFLFTSCRSEGK